MTTSGSRNYRIWFYVGFLTILGFALIWWAGDQFTEIRTTAGAEFRYPRGALLVYLLTLMAAGLVFGMAASQRQTATPSRGAIAGWSMIPLLIIIAFYWTLGWPPGPTLMEGEVLFFVVDRATVVTSCLVFGFFVSRLAATNRPRVGQE